MRMEPTDSPLVAIVDDDELFRRSVERLVRSAGFSVETFGSAEDFLERGNLDRDRLRHSRHEAARHERLRACSGGSSRGLDRMPIVFVSAHEDAILRANALRAGAIAFLKKPFDNSTLLDALTSSDSDSVLLEDAHAGHDRQPTHSGDHSTGAAGLSRTAGSGWHRWVTLPRFEEVLERINRVSATNATVLITGETGTGKELVARAIHRRSRRSSHAMVSANLSALPQ